MRRWKESTGRDRRGSLVPHVAQLTVPRPLSTRGPCPFRAPPGRPCSRFLAAFRATSTRILDVLCVLYSLCLLREQRTVPSDSVAEGGPGQARDAAHRAASPELR